MYVVVYKVTGDLELFDAFLFQTDIKGNSQAQQFLPSVCCPYYSLLQPGNQQMASSICLQTERQSHMAYPNDTYLISIDA